jgi:hypothetical protein
MTQGPRNPMPGWSDAAIDMIVYGTLVFLAALAAAAIFVAVVS